MARATTLAFLAVPFLDEVEAGILPTSTPELGAELGVSGAVAFAVVIAATYSLTIFVEAPLFARADFARSPRQWLRWGLLGVAAACLSAVIAPSLPWLAASAAIFGTASGLVCGLAQGAYVGQALDQAERRLTRWTISAALGDIAGPALVMLVLAGGLTWRAAFMVAGAAALVLAVFLPRWRSPHCAAPIGQEPSDAPRAPLREALAIPGVLPWALATAACTFLDEIVLAYGALQVADRYGEGAAPRALVLGGLVLGAALGLLILERFVDRFQPRRLLAALAGVSALALVAWVLAPTPILAAVAATVLGMSAAGHYPLAQAQAYRAAPGRPGAVNAVLALLMPLEIVIPFALAGVMAASGAGMALLVLATQPLVILAVIVRARRPSG